MPDLFAKFGGHEHAAGLTLASDRVHEFRTRFNDYAITRLTPDDFVPEILIDAEASLADIDVDSVRDIFSMAPFGHSNRAPMLLVRDVEVTGSYKVMKEKHLRFNVRQGARAITMKAWNFIERAAEISPGQRLDVAFRIEEDSYSGWSATVEDIRPATR